MGRRADDLNGVERKVAFDIKDSGTEAQVVQSLAKWKRQDVYKRQVMGICEGIAVLNFGRIIAKGTPDEIRDNPQVIEAYLGKKEG